MKVPVPDPEILGREDHIQKDQIAEGSEQVAASDVLCFYNIFIISIPIVICCILLMFIFSLKQLLFLQVFCIKTFIFYFHCNIHYFACSIYISKAKAK